MTQVGGFAGNVPMPPLIDLDRSLLDEAGAALMDAAGAQLDAARQAGATAGIGGAAQIGADLSGYRIEIEDDSNRRDAFSLPGPGGGPAAGSGVEAAADVPQVLAPLVSLPQAAA